MRPAKSTGLVALVVAVIASAPPAACGDADGGAAVPVSVATTGFGALKLTAEIRLGDGSPIVVQLDSGSNGLRIDRDVLPSQFAPSGPVHRVEFGGRRTMHGRTALVPVTVGGVTTAQPIAVMVVEAITCGDDRSCRTDDGLAGFADLPGIDGIMGIGLDARGLVDGIFNPLLQLGAAHAGGFTIAVDRAGGTLMLGRATPPAGALPIDVPSARPLPDGRPGFEDHHLPLCWQVGTAMGCGATILDTGGPSVRIPASFFAEGVRAGVVARDTRVALLAGADGPRLWSFSTGRGDHEVRIAHESGDDQEANAGIGVFLAARSITYDAVAGRIWVAPRD